MNVLLSMKLFLIKHGKCSACKGTPHHRRCGVCFNTRLEPEVLDAITALDLAEKFKENEGWLFENLSQDDYTRPPEGSYFHHVIEKRQRLEELYSEFINSGAGLEQEGEVFRKLVGELRNGNQVRELPVNGEGPTPR